MNSVKNPVVKKPHVKSGKKQKPKHFGHQSTRKFSSRGPNGEIKGSIEDIKKKYLALAKTALLEGDKVTYHNFYQFADYYSRLSSEEE